MLSKKFMLAAALSALCAAPVSARTINIHGRVTMKGSNEPMFGVTIYNETTDKYIGASGDDGRYSITADSEDVLRFSFLSFEEQTEAVNGRLNIDVSLMPQATELEEVTVVAKATGMGLVTEPTDLDLVGNTIKLKTRVKIPPKMFSSSVRMIVQPAIYNVSRKHVSYLTPVVYDGWRYAVTQERMLDWDKSLDPLTPYQQVKRNGRRQENVIHLIDSLHVDNPDDDFMCVIMSSLENYNKVIYADTFEIARGTVNPLRFLNYSLASSPLIEENYKPLPEVELRDTDGEMNLLFPVGKSDLILTLGNNAAELDALLSEFRTIENDPDMALKSFAIFGYASPEGRFERNKSLARNRMDSAMDKVLESIDPSLRRNAEISSDATVAPWEDVVTMLRADGKDEEADRVQDVIDRYSNPDSRSSAMTRLPFYKNLIATDYLPRLRRVSYHIVSSRYRPLTDEEIAQLYRENPSSLSRYQFYRLYSSKPDGAEREEIIREALKAHPTFVVAATDLADVMLRRNENPYDILEPFFTEPAKWKNLPQSTRLDMGLACIESKNYARADSILSGLPDEPLFHKARIYSSALNGRYREVMQEISEDSPLNEVLLLLALKDNDHAWQKASKLGDSAVEEYVKAVAANRVDEFLAAITHLENAFRLDPSLREVARIDGDVVDLLEENEFNPDNTSENE